MAGTTPTASSATAVSPTLFFDSDAVGNVDFQTLKAASDTIKKNPKLEFSQAELLKLLSYLEGELQARDVVIAALKSENVKNFISTTRCKPFSSNDPNAALFRDGLARSGNFVSRQSSAAAAQSENGMRIMARQRLEELEDSVLQQRLTHLKLINAIKEAEKKHTILMNELEEEKQKHERDTAQGDDITYGLEVERTRLKQDLDAEKQAFKKLEKEMKKVQEQLEAERNRQKPIVLLLLAERKRIIMKYIEERKRSEDLAQILSEEKQRVDTIAEGLEEESKKSLRMEAELEKQSQLFDIERKQYKTTLASDEKKIKEQELEIAQLKAENEMLRKQPQQSQRMAAHIPLNASVPQMSMKCGIGPRAISDPLDDSNAASPMMSSVAKVVQPTATVSSVPVSGPTTGIARSISPGQSLRQPSAEINTFNKVAPRKLSNTTVTPNSIALSNPLASVATGKAVPPPIAPTAAGGGAIAAAIPSVSSSISVSAPIPAPVIQPHATIKKNPSGTPSVGRGVPPPIPPNKPVVPPKREPSATRLLNNNNNNNNNNATGSSVTNSAGTAAAAATVGNSSPNIIKDGKEIQPSPSHLLSSSSSSSSAAPPSTSSSSSSSSSSSAPSMQSEDGAIADIQEYQQAISSGVAK